MKFDRLKFGWLSLFFGVVFLFSSFFLSLKAVALTSSQLDMFSQNNILFYDPDDNCFQSGYSSTISATPFGDLSALQVGFIEQYHETAVKYSIEYGIPWETVVAQGIVESTSGTSPFAVERNNFFGIGAFDSNPNGAYSYSSPEEGWKGYYENIQLTETYRMHGVFAGDTVTNPYSYLMAIKEAGYATDPNYISIVSGAIGAIEELSKDRGWQSSAELAAMYPEWYQNAEANRQGVESSDSSSSSVSSPTSASACSDSGGGGVVSGDVSPEGLTLEQAKKFMMNYGENKNDSSLDATTSGLWYIDCDGGGGSNCSTFSAFFLNKFTNTYVGGTPGYGYHVVSNLRDMGVSTGSQPKVWSVFSWSNDGVGHTGVILGYHDGEWIVGHASCSNPGSGKGDGTLSGGGAGFVFHSASITEATWADAGWPSTLEFAYLGDQVNVSAIGQYLNSGV